MNRRAPSPRGATNRRVPPPPRRRTRPSPPPLVDRLARTLADDPWLALAPLRAFLGVTFCFAGLQKLANPNFFRAASPTSIQAQLIAAERTSPLHPLLGHLLKVATPVGVVIALGELAVGLGVLTGVLTRIAALGGMVLSLMLFLTVSYHASPYYTGADIGFLFAFTPLLIAGAGGRLTLAALLQRMADRTSTAGPGAVADESRRRLVAGAGVGAVGLVLAGLAAGLGRAVGGVKAPRPSERLAGGPTGSTGSTAPGRAGAGSTAPPASTGATTPAPPSSAVAPSGTRIGLASQVPVGGSASFTDPGSGDPAIVVQLSAGEFKAYDAVCPHAGCVVGYSPPDKVIVCPCHGSLFDPSTGSVQQGPAAQGLRTITIADSGGSLYVS